MKIECHVLQVEDHGDKLMVKLQGAGLAEGEQGRCAAQVLELPINERTRRAFYVGRRVMIEVTAMKERKS